MDAAQVSILGLLPNELIAKILAMLDYRDLASCLQVRHLSSSVLRIVAQSEFRSAGVQTRFRSDWQFHFTAISPRIGKSLHGRWSSEWDVNGRA
jgi:hypothetical protein